MDEAWSITGICYNNFVQFVCCWLNIPGRRRVPNKINDTNLMMNSLAVPPLSITNYSPDGWFNWFTNFKGIVKGTPFSSLSDAEKVSVLLSKLGHEINPILFELGVDVSSITYDNLVRQITLYFQPLKARNVLLNLKQKSGESFKQFAERLTIHSFPCLFGPGPLREIYLCDVFLNNIDAMYSNVRTKILTSYPTLKFQEVVDLADKLFFEECGVSGSVSNNEFSFVSGTQRENNVYPDDSRGARQKNHRSQNQVHRVRSFPSVPSFHLDPINRNDLLDVHVLFKHTDISVVSPVGYEETRKAFFKFFNEMQREGPTEVQAGKLYAVRFENSWYRVLVAFILDSNSASVESLDFGWRKTLPLSAFHNLALDCICQPPMAVKVAFERSNNCPNVGDRVTLQFLVLENRLWTVRLMESGSNTKYDNKPKMSVENVIHGQKLNMSFDHVDTISSRGVGYQLEPHDQRGQNCQKDNGDRDYFDTNKNQSKNYGNSDEKDIMKFSGGGKRQPDNTKMPDDGSYRTSGGKRKGGFNNRRSGSDQKMSDGDARDCSSSYTNGGNRGERNINEKGGFRNQHSGGGRDNEGHYNDGGAQRTSGGHRNEQGGFSNRHSGGGRDTEGDYKDGGIQRTSGGYSNDRVNEKRGVNNRNPGDGKDKGGDYRVSDGDSKDGSSQFTGEGNKGEYNTNEKGGFNNRRSGGGRDNGRDNKNGGSQRASGGHRDEQVNNKNGGFNNRRSGGGDCKDGGSQRASGDFRDEAIKEKGGFNNRGPGGGRDNGGAYNDGGSQRTSGGFRDEAIKEKGGFNNRGPGGGRDNGGAYNDGGSQRTGGDFRDEAIKEKGGFNNRGPGGGRFNGRDNKDGGSQRTSGDFRDEAIKEKGGFNNRGPGGGRDNGGAYKDGGSQLASGDFRDEAIKEKGGFNNRGPGGGRDNVRDNKDGGYQRASGDFRDEAIKEKGGFNNRGPGGGRDNGRDNKNGGYQRASGDFRDEAIKEKGGFNNRGPGGGRDNGRDNKDGGYQRPNGDYRDEAIKEKGVFNNQRSGSGRDHREDSKDGVNYQHSGGNQRNHDKESSGGPKNRHSGDRRDHKDFKGPAIDTSQRPNRDNKDAYNNDRSRDTRPSGVIPRTTIDPIPDISELEIEDPPIPKDQYTKVIIVNIIGQVAYVYPESCNEQFQRMSEDLQNISVLLKDAKPGMSCVAPYEGDSYRAEIVEIKGKSAKVLFVDFGNEEDLPLDQLLALPKKYPRLSFPIKEPQSVMMGGLSICDVIEVRLKYMEKGICVVDIRSNGNSGGQVACSPSQVDDAKRDEESKFPNQQSSGSSGRSGSSRSTKTARPVDYTPLRSPKPPIPKNTFTEVRVAHVGDEGSFVFSLSDSDILRRIHETLNPVDESLDLPTCSPSIHKICAAPFGDELFRAKILSIDRTKSLCRVEFIDFGNQSDVRTDDLFELPDDLAKGVYAFKIRFDCDKELKPDGEIISISPIVLEADGTWLVQLEGEPLTADYQLPSESGGSVDEREGFIGFSKNLR
ncbi:hypothetical protein GE061_005395 [Apolygus lucorum]|uniref:Tudor domain-containing protein n=1 Tax=Apolygus lucorum TaxID=248454 RepID=A0A8S9WXW6_APOLU|nr:hypothetical protein GE061_005395 [Apolygus lucorum]